MKRKLIIGLLILALIAVPLFAIACEEEVTPPGEEEEEEGPPPAEEEEEEVNWWDELGEPQYGGTLTTHVNMHMNVWDPNIPAPGTVLYQFEDLVTFDWALDRDIWPFQTNFAPLEYHMGVLAESWETPDPQTLIFNIRQGVHWQDMPPANGREFTAYDVEHHYHRFLGIGSGYTEPSPLAGWLSLTESVTATDDHTVVVKFKEPSVLALYQFFDQANEHQIECPEAVAQGVSNDWEYAVGTGAWMLTDFVEGSAITFSANPDYWGYDERHLENQLPYADTLKVLIIPDVATAIAALRSGQIDIMGNGFQVIYWMQAESLAESNPELQQVTRPYSGPAIDFRVDRAPFTDTRVRKALQMAIDREAMALGYYGGTVDGTPCGLMSPAHEGYYFAYEDWTQELKDEYSYNPDRARELLAEAAADGVFEVNDLGGFDTNVVAAANADLQILQVIQGYFLDIGVDMAITTMDPTSHRAFVVAKQHDQMVYSSMHETATTRPPHNMLYSRYSQELELNLACVNDPAYDALIAALESAANEEEYAQASRDADRYILEHHWSLYTFPLVSYVIYQPYLKGFIGDGSSGGGGVGWGLIYARWWIDQDLKGTMGR